MSVAIINDPPPSYEKSERKSLILNDSSYAEDNPIFMVEPQRNISVSWRRIGRVLLATLVTGVLVVVVLYLCLYGLRRTTKGTNIYIHNEIQINVPVNINIAQTNASMPVNINIAQTNASVPVNINIALTNTALEEEIKTQAQPGRLTAMLNHTSEHGDTMKTRTTATNNISDENIINSSSPSSGQYCLDYFNCFHYEISEENKTWHEAFRYCRKKDMFLPGRDIYFDLRYSGKFPTFMKPKALHGLWSSGKVEHGHYQFLDAKPGFSVSLFSPTIRGYECIKFISDINNRTTFTVANCRDNATTICISPASYFINTGQDDQYGKPRLTVKEVTKVNSTEPWTRSELRKTEPFQRSLERKSRSALFPVLFRPMHLPVIEVRIADIDKIQLECNNIPEDRVIWSRDGIFFNNGVRNTHLYKAPFVSPGSLTLQGAYGCEIWQPGKTKRVASNKIYVARKDTAMVTVVLKKQNVDALAISCTRHPFGCDELLSKNCCWYWNIAERIRHQFAEPDWDTVSWYSVDETVTLTNDVTFNSRVTIYFFLSLDNLFKANWSNMTDPEIMHMTVVQPYLSQNKMEY